MPQLYPGKRHSPKKGARAGTPSGNPLGKNPSDFWQFDAEVAFKVNPIWDFPNVKASHPEKTTHPCQFPSELAERCILALTNLGDMVIDPFVGSGTTAIAAALHGRDVTGIDKDARYIELAKHRLELLARGELPRRPLGKPVRMPQEGERVAAVPEEWLTGQTGGRDERERENGEAEGGKEGEHKAAEVNAGAAAR